jgi:hypothetical protein
VHCAFDLRAFYAQYHGMYFNGETAPEISPTVPFTGTDPFPDGMERIAELPPTLPYEYFAMAAAIESMNIDSTRAQQQWEDYAALIAADAMVLPPISHPVAYMSPTCEPQISEMTTTLEDWGINPDDGGTVEHIPFVFYSQEPVGDCRPLQLDMMVDPTNGSADHVTIASFLHNNRFYPDFYNPPCENYPPCSFPAPGPAGDPQYVYMQFGDIASDPGADPCLHFDASSDKYLDTTGATEPYTHYLSLRSMSIPNGGMFWENWCSPSLTPAVRIFGQGPISFESGPTEVIIGYNPLTGQYFDGVVHEIWIDPDTAIGT